MKEKISRCGIAAAVTLSLALASALPVASQTGDWLKHHKDPQNSAATAATYNPGLSDSVSPAWTFPWPEPDSSTVTDAVPGIYDDEDAGVFAAPGWIDSASLGTQAAPNAYKQHYWLTPVWTPENGTAAQALVATWTLTGLATGTYSVEVFVPSSTDVVNGTVDVANTDHATYTIIDAGGGSHKVTISQVNGGQWLPLPGSYLLSSSSTVSVSAWSDANETIGGPPDPTTPPGGSGGGELRYTDKGRFVKADAIRVVRDRGRIYSSPAVYAASGLPDGATKAVVFGVTYSDPYNRSVAGQSDPDAGDISWSKIIAVDAISGPRLPTSATDRLDEPLWSYPRDAGRDPAEGPIAGAIFSSPLVVDTGTPTVYVGADDGQIYALNALTGRLIWSGPGQTQDDTQASKSGAFTPETPVGRDFFGQGYLHAPASASGSAKVQYRFSELKPYYYQVYAWIPSQPAGVEWAPDAHYSIESGGTTTKVQVNQGSCATGGSGLSIGPRWVRVGAVQFADGGDLTVTLTNETTAGPTGCRGGDLHVVADAIRVVPENVDGFGYCSATLAGNRIISANPSGRIIALETQGSGKAPFSTDTAWIWPRTRQATGEFDELGVGGMTNVPAIDGSSLFYGTTTGNYGKLTGINSTFPTRVDTFTLQKSGANAAPLPDIGSITAAPVVSSDSVFFATSSGHVFKASKNDGSVEWVYPEDFPTTGTPPLPVVVGSFRYGSPSLVKAGNPAKDYLIAGSADGYIHEIPVDGSGDIGKVEMGGPIYSSVAAAPANGAQPGVAYFGTQTSLFQGLTLDKITSDRSNYPSRWGWSTLASNVFSSPAIARGVAVNWIYVGGDDGRLYAFTENGGGSGEGSWPVGNPYIGDAPGAHQHERFTGGSPFFDLEIVSSQQYNDPAAYFSSLGLDKESTSVNRRPNSPWDSGRLEWGDTLYILAWSFLNQGANVTFQMQNQGQGEQAGSLLTASQSANLSWPDHDITLNIDGQSYTGRFYYAKFAWTLDPTKLLTPGDAYVIKGSLTPTKNTVPYIGFVQASVPESATISSFDSKRNQAEPKKFIINHPMAIAFDPRTTVDGLSHQEAWTGLPGAPFQPTRTDAGTTYNGVMNRATVMPADKTPAKHGGNTVPVTVALADRSVLGITRRNNPTGIINTLRADRGVLRWISAPINPLPWEIIPPADTVNISPDYPDIPSTAFNIVKKIEGADPTRGNAHMLPAAAPATVSGETRTATPDPLLLTVDVPRYQPANRPGSPYGDRVNVWIDATEGGTRNGVLDLADQRLHGRPLNGSEAYRDFNYIMDVAPDFNMYAEQTVVDLGKRPIGFGIGPVNLNPLEGMLPFSGAYFQPGVPATDLFKPFTIRNDGNVNELNVRLAKGIYLFSDQVQAIDLNSDGVPDVGFGLSGGNLISSLDPAFDPLGVGGPPAWALPNGLGHVITKPRVGDLGPTTFTVPDRRQQQYMTGSSDLPPLPLVSVSLPIGTPSGTYAQVVPVFSDLNNNGILDLDRTGRPAEPVASPSFQVKITAREGKMTDDPTVGSLPNVESPPSGAPRWGDAQPTAFRQWSRSGGTVQTGDLGVIWTSNRQGTNPNASTSQPWFLYQSVLKFDPSAGPLGSYVYGGSAPANQWWTMADPADAIPDPGQAAALFADGLPGNVIDTSVKFTSPSVGQDQTTGETWVTFTGQADKLNNGVRATEYRIFYARIGGNGQMQNIQSIPSQDATTPKASPRIVPVQDNGTTQLYVFWHAGVGGRYKLYYNFNRNAGSPSAWGDDKALVIPRTLVTAAEPVPMLRIMPPYAFSTGDTPTAHIDVVYSGITRTSGNPDLLLTRYRPSANDNNKMLDIQRLSRVYDEELQRDTSAVSLFYSRHLAWVRPTNGMAPPASDDVPDYQYPIIHVLKWNSSNGKYTPMWVNSAPAQLDSQVGVVLYDTTKDPVLGPLFGRIIVDTSAGTVKFEKLLSGKDKVLVDYTPQTWRLTATTQPDTSPYSFIEKTQQFTQSKNRRDPSILPPDYDQPMAIDRMWLFWREGAGAVHANTLYYKTLRLGLQLKRSIALQSDGMPVSLQVHEGPSGIYNGPFQFDWANNRLLFTEDAENRPIWVEYQGRDGQVYREPEGFSGPRFKALTWIPEQSEAPDQGTVVPVDTMVNEGQIYAFADPDGLRSPEDPRYKPSLIWLFWTSSRAGSSDIFYQTISPPLRSVTRVSKP
ncbi:MAG: PQQ-binding-like beta-propeller repeat protein [Armatimonadetes bacterium]|nr:PQQ-binding-like beta-propeller repeat protein [Armatimonadota bacterium]